MHDMVIHASPYASKLETRSCGTPLVGLTKYVHICTLQCNCRLHAAGRRFQGEMAEESCGDAESDSKAGS